MDQRNSETHGVPNGAGGGGNTTPTGVHRDETASEASSTQETSTQSTSGESQGNQTRVHCILPERGDLTGYDLGMARQYLKMLYQRRSVLIQTVNGLPIGSDEWYEGIDEITALCDSIEALRREFRRN